MTLVLLVPCATVGATGNLSVNLRFSRNKRLPMQISMPQCRVVVSDCKKVAKGFSEAF